VKFFFDNNLAIKLAHGLDQMVSPNHRVVHLRDEFLPNVEDAVWMTALAKEEDLVIITADVAISRNPHEVKAWKEAGHTVFFSSRDGLISDSGSKRTSSPNAFRKLLYKQWSRNAVQRSA
jgi:PIN like domain